MGEEHIKKILTNFREQYSLYRQMQQLSARQLAITANKSAAIQNELHEILEQRSYLLGSILILDQANKEMQQKANQEFGINEFVLSQLQEHISTTDYQELKELVAQIGQLLNEINDNDQQSQLLMRNGLSQQGPKTTNKKAQNMYRQSMLKKSPDK